jgi:hypothetical protein
VSAPVESDTTDKGYYEIRMGDADEENAIVEFHPNGAGDPIHLQNELASMRVKALHGSIYGVPNIPDFMVSVDNRDIIEQQNAWAEVWLSRNRSLGDRPTHPAFVYRTSRVRFGNMITPLLVNSKEWHIEELSSDHQRPFAVHLEQLFKTLLPENATKAYDLRIGCGYAFALAEGAVGKPDLLVPLPVTLGPRFSVNPGRGMLKATAPFRQNLETAIHQWWNVNQPSKSKGMFVFKLDIHSSAGSLPLLRIDDLRLELKNITDL